MDKTLVKLLSDFNSAGKSTNKGNFYKVNVSGVTEKTSKTGICGKYPNKDDEEASIYFWKHVKSMHYIIVFVTNLHFINYSQSKYVCPWKTPL